MSPYQLQKLESRINFFLDCGLYTFAFIGLVIISLVIGTKYF